MQPQQQQQGTHIISKKSRPLMLRALVSVSPLLPTPFCSQNRPLSTPTTCRGTPALSEQLGGMLAAGTEACRARRQKSI